MGKSGWTPELVSGRWLIGGRGQHQPTGSGAAPAPAFVSYPSPFGDAFGEHIAASAPLHAPLQSQLMRLYHDAGQRADHEHEREADEHAAPAEVRDHRGADDRDDDRPDIATGDVGADREAAPPGRNGSGDGLLQTFDFTDAGDLPAGVTVVRAGTTATRRTGAQTVEVMAANTLRYEYDAAGVLLGLLCEKARTNLVSNAVNVGAAFNDLGAVTITENYGFVAAPNGANEATQIQVAVGDNYRGLRLGLSSVTGGRLMQVWARAIGSTMELTYRDPSDNDVHAIEVSPSAWTLLNR